MTKKKVDINTDIEKLVSWLKVIRRYSVVIFLVFIVALYGFLMLRISSLSSGQPSQEAVSSQVQAAQIPHIDQSIVNQLQTLQDNSVNVQALFNQARSNPFQ
jgi:hypothetical protein